MTRLDNNRSKALYEKKQGEQKTLDSDHHCMDRAILVQLTTSWMQAHVFRHDANALSMDQRYVTIMTWRQMFVKDFEDDEAMVIIYFVRLKAYFFH